jgi:hypothetical protein
MRVRSVLKTSTLGVAALFAISMSTIDVSNADVATFNITSDHCTGGCLGGLSSLGTVTVNDAGGNLAFSIDLTSSNSGFVKTGFDGSFAFNLVGNPVITYSAITATGGAAFTPVGGNPVGAQNLTQFDGFGSFEYAVIRTQNGGGAQPKVTNLSFSIDAAADLTLASLQQTVFAGGSTFFVLDVISGVTGNTGLVDASPGTSAVPLPGALPLFLTGLGGLVLMGRRKKQVAAPVA